MDPFLHLLLPVLFLLAIRIDPRKVIMFAPLAIVPDFDAFLGMHREVLHSFIPVLVLPLSLIIFSKLRKPEWMSSALLIQFYLASHIVLDLGGVTFFWPFFKEQFFFDPVIKVNVQGGIHFILQFAYGWRAYAPMTTSDIMSESGFAVLLLGVLSAIVFRKEACASLLKLWRTVVGFFSRKA